MVIIYKDSHTFIASYYRQLSEDSKMKKMYDYFQFYLALRESHLPGPTKCY